MQSWGFIEVIGYIPAVAAADAMVKAADIQLAGTEAVSYTHLRRHERRKPCYIQGSF